MKKIYIVLFLSLITVNLIQTFRYDKLVGDYSKTYNNYISEKRNGSVLVESIDQLRYEQDKLIAKYDSIKKDNKIKDKNVQQITYHSTIVNIKDSIRFIDYKNPVFNKDVNIDTIIKKKDHTLQLNLKYPNKMDYNIKIYNERIVIVSDSTVYPKKKKIFPLNLFQKKLKVSKVKVFDSNKAIETVETKIIKTK